MEKARDGEGNYAAIRDVGRLSLIIEDFLLMPDVVEALFDCQDFEVSRIKNRLDPDHTAGYRDVQLLVREPKGKWIVEVQVIPQEMYELKNKDGYTKYRFIFEACKRAIKQQASRHTFSNGTSQRGVASDGVGHATILNSAYEHHPATEGNVVWRWPASQQWAAGRGSFAVGLSIRLEPVSDQRQPWPQRPHTQPTVGSRVK